MWNPLTALLWQCWRLSRRWYLLVLMIAVAAHLGLMNLPPPRRLPPTVDYHESLGMLAVVVNLALAVCTTLFAITAGGRGGFPLRFEYRLPVRPTLLVAVPLLYLSAACASVYVIPVLLGRLIYGIPFPIVSAAMLVTTIVTALAAGSWSATGTNTRTAAFVLICMMLLSVFGWMRPFNMSGAAKPGEPIFRADIIAFTLSEYGLLILLCLFLFGVIVCNVSLQRGNVTWRLPWRKQTAAASESARKSRSQSNSLIEKISDLFSMPCPIGSPWHAELWFELKRYGMPQLARGLLCALSLPIVLVVAQYLGLSRLEIVGGLAAVGIFFIGIGTAFFQRRLSSDGYMNAFEGTRGMSTLQLAGIQFLVAGGATLISIALVNMSLLLSLRGLGKPDAMMAAVQALTAGFAGASLLAQASGLLTAATLYFALIALLVGVHSCSVFWGRKVLYGMVAFVLYCMAFTNIVAIKQIQQQNVLATIQHHMWGFAVVVLLITLILAGRVIYLRLLSLQAGITSVLAWGIFLACAWVSLQARGIELLNQASELQAFNVALLMLPFTLYLLTAWSYDRLRHR